MPDNYGKITQDNLRQLYGTLPKDLSENLPGEQIGQQFHFGAFGTKCVIDQNGVTLGEQEHSSVLGLMVSVYALNAKSENCVLSPLKSFQEFPGSASHVSASAMPTSKLLRPYVAEIKKAKQSIVKAFNGVNEHSEVGGDFSFLLYPLPKIALCYIFYEADADFPASVRCLYSYNANQYIPVSGLADLGEYTSRQILKLIGR
ncbi:MAG: DUF3786 domain-containing protein [Proteobacteria bacterium]|nr:DUF3786 domain-containing protein [Pseudomonadota bacterium]